MRVPRYGLLVCCLCVAGWAGTARADDNADAAPILAKAIKAMGGAEKLAKLQSASYKGKSSFQEGGQEITVNQEGSWKGVNQVRLDVDVQVGGESKMVLLVVNGDKVWIKNKDNNAVQEPAGIAPFFLDLAYALRSPALLPLLKDKAFALAPLGEVKVDDKPAVGVRVTHKDRKELRLWFDKGSGLLVKSEISLTDPQGKNITVETAYSDYKDFDGGKRPGKLLMKADGKEVPLEITELQAEESFDDAHFAKPS